MIINLLIPSSLFILQMFPELSSPWNWLLYLQRWWIPDSGLTVWWGRQAILTECGKCYDKWVLGDNARE